VTYTKYIFVLGTLIEMKGFFSAFTIMYFEKELVPDLAFRLRPSLPIDSDFVFYVEAGVIEKFNHIGTLHRYHGLTVIKIL